MYHATVDIVLTKAILLIFFIFRVFADRLVDETDKESFVGLIGDKLGSLFDLTYHNLCPNKQPPIFGECAFFSVTR